MGHKRVTKNHPVQVSMWQYMLVLLLAPGSGLCLVFEFSCLLDGISEGVLGKKGYFSKGVVTSSQQSSRIFSIKGGEVKYDQIQSVEVFCRR